MVLGDGYEPIILHTSTIDANETEILPLDSVNCYPNPFNPEVTLSFQLAENALVNLSIYNSKGQKVREFKEYCNSGSKQFIWNGKDENQNIQANGIYFYRLTSGNNEFSGKMIMLK